MILAITNQSGFGKKDFGRLMGENYLKNETTDETDKHRIRNDKKSRNEIQRINRDERNGRDNRFFCFISLLSLNPC
jgi:hypothetical protein